MKNCETCKHWSPPERRRKMGFCRASSPGIWNYSPVTGERLMEAMCDEDRGYLETAPTFFCAHWEPLGP